jgi:hypothetical protein
MRTLFWGAILVSAAVIAAFANMIIGTALKMDWTDVLREHCAAIFGLPGAVATAFIIVIFLRQTVPVQLLDQRCDPLSFVTISIRRSADRGLCR